MDALQPLADSDNDNSVRAVLSRLRLHAHAVTVRAAAASSAGVGLLLVWALGHHIEPGLLAAWALALVGVIALRLWVARQYRASLSRPGPARPWLRWFRAAIGLHGLVWGAAAWLPDNLADLQVQQLLVALLATFALASVLLTLSDLRAALMFAVLVLAPLALRLIALDGPLPKIYQLTGTMALLLLCLLAMTGRRLSRARLALATNLNGREAAQRALAAQQRQLALVQEHTSLGFWAIDNQWRTTDANPAMCRMLGQARAQVLGRSIYDFVDEANALIFRHHAARRDNGVAEGYEISLRRADGSLVHCYNNATPILDDQQRKLGALGLFSDITAQKRAEQQVRQTGLLLAQRSQALTRTLESLDHGVLHIDPQGRCVAWNQRMLALLDLPPGLLASGRSLADLVRYQQSQGYLGPQFERLGPDAQADLWAYLRGHSTRLTPRYQRPSHDGRMLEVVTHAAADGGMVRTYTDITDRQAADAAVRAAKDEAVQANQAKSAFLSRMSHELRTPMNAILGFGQLLEADRQEPLTHGQAQRVQQLLRGGRHLLTLIDDVLDIARIEAGRLQLDLQPVDLAALVDEVLRLMQPVAQARQVHLVQQHVPAARASAVWADPTRLRQVLLNLLSNAIKFNREGGLVTVRCFAHGGRVELVVADQGQGISAAQLDRLFQPFERLGKDSTIEGSGIGLSHSRSLVQQMQGEIGVRSQPGSGSEFWLRLPQATLAGVTVAPVLPASDAAVATAQSRHSVLYIEDNPVNLLLMEGMLAHRPAIDLRLAALPEQGLAMARAEAPDLVLLDIHLPGIDGFEVLRRLRASPGLGAVPVVAVSASVMPADHALAAQAGFDAYLGKPVHLQSLLALVDRVLAGQPAQPA